jgi:hypothetical protein
VIRATWILSTGNGVVRKRLYERGINFIGYDPHDPGAAEHMNAVRKEGRTPFFFSDPRWYGLHADGSALKYRQQLDSDCARLLKAGEPLMVDLEQVSMEYVRRLLNGSAGNRGLVGSNNPSNSTGTQADKQLWYSNEPFQDGTVVPIPELVAAGAHWFPQLYYGPMTPADSAAVVLEIARWGFPADRIHPFYDGMLIASDQRDGAYFTAERIPGVFTA